MFLHFYLRHVLCVLKHFFYFANVFKTVVKVDNTKEGVINNSGQNKSGNKAIETTALENRRKILTIEHKIR